MFFDRDYCEKVRLSDGTVVILRCIRPTDKTLLREGFEQLSPESRYRRFFSPKLTLTDAELKYLTECDGIDHLALGAETLDAEGNEIPLGVARFVRLADDPEAAEAAVAVIDPYQGRGLGTLLVQRLIAAARERGVTHFHADVFLDNAPAIGLLDDVGLSISASAVEDGVASVDLALPVIEPQASPADAPRSSPLYALFRAVARGAAGVAGAVVPMAARRKRARVRGETPLSRPETSRE